MCDKITAECFFCGKKTEDAVADGFVPDFFTSGIYENTKPIRHTLPACPDCSNSYLLEEKPGERWLQAWD